jgi:ABC-type Fe3+-hydroxamate transport system substrate-binding protein
MRVISMVPSWTETLIEAGVEIVGRTRFCIHPENQVKNIAVVGGTKNIDWEKVKALKADLLLLDREENPQSMAKDSPIPVFDTHIGSVTDVPRELVKLSKCLSSDSLKKIAARWQSVVETQSRPSVEDLARLPGVEKWIKTPQGQKNFLYLIWKDPWMAVGRDTFIDSMFQFLGFSQNILATHTKGVSGHAKYPELDLQSFDPKDTVLLLSSEPYPFRKRNEFLKDYNFSAAIVDGELWSWFGVRSLRFLEEEL